MKDERFLKLSEKISQIQSLNNSSKSLVKVNNFEDKLERFEIDCQRSIKDLDKKYTFLNNELESIFRKIEIKSLNKSKKEENFSKTLKDLQDKIKEKLKEQRIFLENHLNSQIELIFNELNRITEENFTEKEKINKEISYLKEFIDKELPDLYSKAENLKDNTNFFNFVNEIQENLTNFSQKLLEEEQLREQTESLFTKKLEEILLSFKFQIKQLRTKRIQVEDNLLKILEDTYKTLASL